MADTKTTLEIHYEVWEDKQGVKLNIGPDSDGFSCVQLCTKDAKSEEYWGKLRVVFPPAIARNVAKALLKCADDLEPEA
jgi:hypothetical protein